MKKLTSNIGDVFGDWTVIGNPYSKHGHTYVKVKCKCGKESDLCLSDLKNKRVTSCKNCAAQKRGHMSEIKIGDKIKHWIVIDGPQIKNNTVQFKVQCDCGTSERWIQPNELLNPNKCFCCQKCAHKYNTQKLMLSQYNKIKHCAEIRNIKFMVSLQYLQELWNKQNHKCAITGQKIDNIRNASLDRIDSTKDYVQGNVQWTTVRANLSKHTMTMEELYNFCKQVLNHANQQLS